MVWVGRGGGYMEFIRNLGSRGAMRPLHTTYVTWCGVRSSLFGLLVVLRCREGVGLPCLGYAHEL